MLTTHRSLDPQCTPLKHRYDSCFNLWFEGYLQPALDARSSTSLNTRLANAAQEHAPVRQNLDTPAPQDETASSSDQSEPSLRKPLVTSWSSAFPSRVRSTTAVETEDQPAALQSEKSSVHVATPQTLVPIDTRGKTRAQIKAEEYERACGEHWRRYQECLKVSSF